MNSLQEIPLPAINSRLFWFIGPRAKFEKLMNKKFGPSDPLCDPDVEGEFFVAREGHRSPAGAIWLPRYNICSLVHECFHAVHWTMQFRGARLSNDSEEIYAYYLGYILGEILAKRKAGVK